MKTYHPIYRIVHQVGEKKSYYCGNNTFFDTNKSKAVKFHHAPTKPDYDDKQMVLKNLTKGKKYKGVIFAENINS